MVTHNPTVASQAERVVRVKDGKIESDFQHRSLLEKVQ
jgi:ABC-type lipoprotein export system ATPase subunit